MRKKVSEIDDKFKNIEDKKLGVNVVNDTVKNATTNINTGTVNNITLVAHGKEDMTKLIRDEVIDALKNGFDSTTKLIENVHFNPRIPEYHNVYIPSMKDKYAMVYDGNDWNIVRKDDLIDELYDNKRNYIEENLDDFVNSLSKSRKDALKRWLDKDDDFPYIQKVKNDIKLLLYNKRRMIKYNKICNASKVEQLDNDTNKNVKRKKVIKTPKIQTIVTDDESEESAESAEPIKPEKNAKTKNIKIDNAPKKETKIRKCKISDKRPGTKKRVIQNKSRK